MGRSLLLFLICITVYSLNVVKGQLNRGKTAVKPAAAAESGEGRSLELLTSAGTLATASSALAGLILPFAGAALSDFDAFEFEFTVGKYEFYMV